MVRGLEGRRILVAVLPGVRSSTEQAEAVRSTLERAGAEVEVREADAGADESWRGGLYAGLVAVGGDGAGPSKPRLVQLVREFLASEKPVAAVGGALASIIEAGGVGGRAIAGGAAWKTAVESAGGKWVAEPVHADGCLVTASDEADIAVFAASVAKEFAQGLDEREVDTMSEQSFPASDPPSTTPGSVGHVAPDRDTGAQPDR